jgi:hypothetical protein
MHPPEFFQAIRDNAARRWDQLDADPELAAPWHHLFRQVQSPRHVLSELLQNADDAGATAAAVRVEDSRFVFSHDGEDFAPDHFNSICRFGYSNKRSLHTIGFRGIGFKSAFSLGDEVKLRTPNLSVIFHSRRFTEPIWDGTVTEPVSLTTISVSLRDALIEREISKTLRDWQASPLSLLFFKNIRRLTVGDEELRWESLGPGPASGTEWMALNGRVEEPHLLARSSAEEFPKDALEEIARERMLPPNEEVEYPRACIDIVLGAKGLYVVLNAGVDANLPFACNAPFIQDPARLKIKDPETSPTNRWLLARAGRFAASIMLDWVGNSASSLKERSCAYEVMPRVNRDDRSLQGICATTVELAFADAIADQCVLLTDLGDTTPAGKCVIVPEQLLDIWSQEQVSSMLDPSSRPAFSRHVAARDRQKLIDWKKVEQITRPDVIGILRSKHLPRPQSWNRLLKLWNFIYPETTGYRPAGFLEGMCILPVQGKEALHSASEIVRLGEKRLLASDADWDFLAGRLLALNPNWPRYLAEQRRLLESRSAQEELTEVDRALSILRTVGMDDASDVNKLIARFCTEFFAEKSHTLAECVQLSQIAAKLNVSVAGALRFATRDVTLRAAEASIVYDKDGNVERLVPDGWASSRLLHENYSSKFQSCTSEEWHRWVSSGRSGLLTLMPIQPIRKPLWSRTAVEAELRSRGVHESPTYSYKAENYRLEDWDFEEALWSHWSSLAEHDDKIWARIADEILTQPERYWSTAKAARMLQSSGRGNANSIIDQAITPKWVLRLSEKPCLRDTRGFLRRPAELLRCTPETLALLDVEAFIEPRFDHESVRPLLDLLGVGSTPTGPDRLLDRLRALAQSEAPPVAALEKLYRSLDRLIDACSTDDLIRLKSAFREERIVFTDSGNWSNARGVFIASDLNDLPDTEVVRSSVRDLSMWHKLGVPDRPTPEVAISWLLQLPSGGRLSAGDGKRVKELLALYPSQIWNECGRWLNLSGELVPIENLEFSLSRQSGTPFNHLHDWVKQQTADFLKLSAETSESVPFSSLTSLGSQIEERFQQSPMLTQDPEDCPWLNQLGKDLKRIVPRDGETDTELIRIRASDLARTVLQIVPKLELTPYLKGVPAGTPRSSEACWANGVLYVQDRPMAKLAKTVARELGRAFGRSEIEEAIKFCFDRPPEFVGQYMEENFNLGHGETDEPPSNRVSSSETTDSASVSNSGRQDDHKSASLEVQEAIASSLTPPLAPSSSKHDLSLEEQVPVQRTVYPPRPAKPSIMERFALGEGFLKDSADRFYHTNGSWIAKPSGERFWEWRTIQGEVLRYLYAREICLEREPLEIDAEDWRMIEAHPEAHTMILIDPEDRPIAVSGSVICKLKEDGTLRLYQTHFRLVCEDQSQASGLLNRSTRP